MYIYRFVLAAILLIIIQMIIFIIFSQKKLVYRRYFSKDRVFEGDDVFMIEEIYNNKILPEPWIKIESQISDNLLFGGTEDLYIKHEGLHESIFSILPYTKITRKHKVICSKRGVYNLGNVYISSGTLLGGGATEKEFETLSNLVVFPKIDMISELPIKNHNVFGEYIMKRWILKDPFIISGTREYTYSEPLKMINWKATARTNSLRVNNLDFSSDHKVMILLNIDLSEDEWKASQEPDVFEKLIRIAATFAYESLKKGIETGFGTNASRKFNEKIDIIRPKGGSEQIIKILSAMSEMKHKRHLSFHTFLKNEVEVKTTNYDYLIISWYTSSKLTKYADILLSKGNSVLFLIRKDLSIIEKNY